MKVFIHASLIFITFLSFVADSPAQPLFEVEREAFCREVRDHEPVDSLSGFAKIRKGGGLFLWMEIKAGERALTMLEAKGEMPVYHAWASGVGITDMINIGITKERWLEQADAIRSEVKKRGFFTWRTQSFKRNFREGDWYVSVLDANKRTVKKTGSGAEAFRPEIVVKFVPDRQ
ncbi:MAG: DUF2914 domain-containing protein [Thermodesulfobacteriota bacterium]|nr:DUF2914 domain-containing protein [Thermodesulfobacteriota bacterium]